MTSWYEKYDFLSDPYERQDPYHIDLSQIKWDRNDLPNERIRLTQFVEDAANGKKTSIKIFGPYGSGKTWMTRLIEKEIIEKFDGKKDSIAFLYTKIPKAQNTFEIVFRLAMEHFLENILPNVTKHMNEPTLLPEWERIFSNTDFAKCCRIYYNKHNEILAKKWITGYKLTSSEIGKLGLSSSLSGDYDRYAMLQELCKNLSKIFSTTILVVDELENADVKLGSQLSDALRDILDSFSEKFVLICSFSAQREAQWYDGGYSEALYSRIDHNIMINNLDKETLENFLRTYHELYRKPTYEKDQLLPFDKSGLLELFDQTPAGNRVPRYFFHNCLDIARLASGKGKDIIDSSFVSENVVTLSAHK